MNIKKQIKVALAYAGITQTELARRLGTTLPNFTQKTRRDTFKVNDMIRIADALGCEWKQEFKFPDGTTV